MATTPPDPVQAAQNVWRTILTAQVLGRISAQGMQRQFQPPFTVVAVAEQNCETFVTRYRLSDDPIAEMIYGTKGQLVTPRVLIFLFDKYTHPNVRPPLCGEIDANLNLTWF